MDFYQIILKPEGVIEDRHLDTIFLCNPLSFIFDKRVRGNLHFFQKKKNLFLLKMRFEKKKEFFRKENLLDFLFFRNFFLTAGKKIESTEWMLLYQKKHLGQRA